MSKRKSKSRKYVLACSVKKRDLYRGSVAQLVEHRERLSGGPWFNSRSNQVFFDFLPYLILAQISLFWKINIDAKCTCHGKKLHVFATTNSRTLITFILVPSVLSLLMVLALGWKYRHHAQPEMTDFSFVKIVVTWPGMWWFQGLIGVFWKWNRF